jgi:hypothetical protein
MCTEPLHLVNGGDDATVDTSVVLDPENRHASVLFSFEGRTLIAFEEKDNQRRVQVTQLPAQLEHVKTPPVGPPHENNLGLSGNNAMSQFRFVARDVDFLTRWHSMMIKTFHEPIDLFEVVMKR